MMMPSVREIAEAARRACRLLGQLTSAVKDHALQAMAEALWERREETLTANARDVEDRKSVV